MRGSQGNPVGICGFRREVLIFPASVPLISVGIGPVARVLGWGRDQPKPQGPQSPTWTLRPAGYAHDSVQDGVASRPLLDLELNPLPTAPFLWPASCENVPRCSDEGACDERGFPKFTVGGGDTCDSDDHNGDDFRRGLFVSGSDFSFVQSAVAGAADCKPEGLGPYDSGASWTDGEQSVVRSALSDRADSTQVLWSGKPHRGSCCDKAQVEVTSGVASVVCSHGSQWGVQTESARWVNIDRQNTHALNGSEGRWVSAVESSDCEVTGPVQFDDKSFEPSARAPAGGVGPIALDLAGNTLLVSAEDKVPVAVDIEGSFN